MGINIEYSSASCPEETWMDCALRSNRNRLRDRFRPIPNSDGSPPPALRTRDGDEQCATRGECQNARPSPKYAERHSSIFGVIHLVGEAGWGDGFFSLFVCLVNGVPFILLAVLFRLVTQRHLAVSIATRFFICLLHFMISTRYNSVKPVTIGWNQWNLPKLEKKPVKLSKTPQNPVKPSKTR